MRKNIGISLVSVFFGVVIIGSSLFAQPYTSDTGYVIVRCTVSISVDVLDANATAWFVAVGTQTSTLSTGQTDVSITSIAVRNTSSGAVLKYAVYVSSIQRSSDGINWISDDDDFGSMIKGWYLTQDGVLDSVGEFQLAAVFASSRPASGEFQTTNTGTRGADEFRMNASTFSITNAHRAAYTYKTGGEDFDPATTGLRYSSALYNSTGTNAVAPHPLTHSTRLMWFLIRTPSAVTDELPRRILIRVEGGLGSSW